MPRALPLLLLLAGLFVLGHFALAPRAAPRLIELGGSAASDLRAPELDRAAELSAPLSRDGSGPTTFDRPSVDAERVAAERSDGPPPPVRVAVAGAPRGLRIALTPVHGQRTQPLPLQSVDSTLEVERGGPTVETHAQIGAAGSEWRVEIEVAHDAPRGVPLELTVVGNRSIDLPWLWTSKQSLVLPPTTPRGATEWLDLGDVPFLRTGTWLAGLVESHPRAALQGARVEVMEFAHDGQRTTAFEVDASAFVDDSGRFRVEIPDRDVAARVRARVVLIDGTTLEHAEALPAFQAGVVLRTWRDLSISGDVLWLGRPAAGLFSAHAEQGGQRYGESTVRADGSFELRGVPPIGCDVVLMAVCPRVELTRVPFGAMPSADKAGQVALGALELSTFANVLELELTDRTGAPAAASLSWVGAVGRGRSRLGPRPTHRLLLPKVGAPILTVERGGGLGPLPLADPIGRVAVLVEP